MESIFKHFASFIKRSMLPASVLLLFLVLFEIRDSKIKTFIEDLYIFQNTNIYITIFIILVLLISISYLMSILTQILFDNNMKENFNALIFYKNEDRILNLLREKTILKLQQENNQFEGLQHTDYFLYQIIGRKLQFLKYSTNTTRYIDEIKSSGSIFISILISLFIQTTLLTITVKWYYSILGLFIMGLVYFIAREYLLSKYRSRSLRMYSNYLVGDNQPS